jgi:hypothetical protein
MLSSGGRIGQDELASTTSCTTQDQAWAHRCVSAVHVAHRPGLPADATTEDTAVFRFPGNLPAGSTVRTEERGGAWPVGRHPRRQRNAAPALVQNSESGLLDLPPDCLVVNCHIPQVAEVLGPIPVDGIHHREGWRCCIACIAFVRAFDHSLCKK